MRIEKKDDGGLIYRDSQGNKLMESFPDGMTYEDVYGEKPEDNPARAYIFENTIKGANMEFPHGVKIRPDPEREGYTRFTAYSDEDEFDKELQHLKPVKEFLDELTDEERRYLFTYYCHECGTKDVPCRCWDDT